MIRSTAIIAITVISAFAAIAGGQFTLPVGSGSAALAQGVPLPTPTAASTVCSDPAVKCDHKQKHFDDWELPFKIPAKLAANKPYRSSPFYAVMLKTFEIEDDCDGGEFVIAVEKERKKLQKNEPGRKVFASYQCPNMGAVDYDFEGKMDAAKENVLIGNFIAIYAGTTRAEAEEMLAPLKKSYPNAVIKKMTASFEVIDQ